VAVFEKAADTVVDEMGSFVHAVGEYRADRVMGGKYNGSRFRICEIRDQIGSCF
jgi:hypothetical protein